jgi:hypothetical protein
MTMLTPARADALRWLQNQGGTGIFTNLTALLAGGEIAPFTRTTWNALQASGHVTIEGKRLSYTAKGLQYLMDNPPKGRRLAIQHVKSRGEQIPRLPRLDEVDGDSEESR